jgi:hypothetical protein
MAIVYQATNLVNGKRYIGLTGRTLKKRRAGHLQAARGTKSNMIFHKAIRKHGAHAFEWKVRHDFLFDEDAIVCEASLIAKEKPEYNLSGGQGILGLRHSSETKARLRERAIRHIPLFLTYRHLGAEAVSRKVVCTDDGKEYSSASEAARIYGVAKSAIIELCNGNHPHRHSIGGRHFRYAEETQSEKDAHEKRASGRRRSKLNAEMVRQIRALRGTMSYSKIGSQFGVSGATVGDVLFGRCWSHVE